jgi:hypothetical protein
MKREGNTVNVGQIVSLDMPFGAVKKACIDQIIDEETVRVTVLVGKYKNNTYRVNKMYVK